MPRPPPVSRCPRRRQPFPAEALLDREELTIWRAARDKAKADGLLMMAHPLHAAVGRKPNS